VLDIGANDFFKNKRAGLQNRLQWILDALPKGTPLICNGLMPTETDGITMQEIQETNAAIKAICEANTHCAYLDTWQLFVDEKGQQDYTLFQSDQVHLNTAGYQRWIAALKKVLGEEALDDNALKAH